MDDSEELLEEGRRVKKRRDDYLQGVRDNASKDQVDDMMSYSTAHSGNLRGSRSGSTSSFIPHEARSLLSTASDKATGDPTDIPFEK